MERSEAHPGRGIWALAFGYFAAYVPYAMLTKAASQGALPFAPEAVAGLAILPLATAVSALGMLMFLGATGYLSRLPRRRLGPLAVPCPPLPLVLSGACTAAIVTTTTLAYTFEGASIVLLMLLMRGGVLVLAPIVDKLSRRRVRWWSWVALALSCSAIALGTGGSAGALTLAALADVCVYLAAYFGRLRLMSALAKSDRESNVRYFAGEQLVATPLALAALAAIALAGGGLGEELRRGFVEVPLGAAAPWIVAIGLLSQATGIFGSLVLLDARENTFSVVVNRASSLIAGVAATFALWLWLGEAPPRTGEVAGAALVLGATLLLALAPRAKAQAPEPGERRVSSPTAR
jgi:hypothetical protein